MSICIAALVVLAVMSIFSAKYRKWAKEAMDCVARRMTLRPCTTKFNEKVRAVLASKLMRRSPGLAGFTHRHFEAISWVFTIILFVSIGLTVFSVYNLVVHGTCDLGGGECPFGAPVDQCSPGCQPCQCGTDMIGCGAPLYEACGGDCQCVAEVCGS